MSAFLTINNASAGYGAIEVLGDISLTLSKGERLAVLGRNGAGKSTLMKLIIGLSTLHSGTVCLDGRDISSMAPDKRAKCGIGYVPQTRNIFKSLTVEENLLTGLKGRRREALEESYSLFPRLYERRRSGGQDLSGGEQQMLAIARTLLGEPSLLLLDEPLEGLAPLICEQLMRSFIHLAASSNIAVILVEQKIEDALRFSDRVIVLENGTIALSCESDVLRTDQRVLDRYLAIA